MFLRIVGCYKSYFVTSKKPSFGLQLDWAGERVGVDRTRALYNQIACFGLRR
jgi:hypothetical protein